MRKIALAFLLVLSFTTFNANAQYFGRNKVQWEQFNFKVLKTEHFDIYYYDREADVVNDVGRMSERWYERLSRVFNHSFTRKPIVLYANPADFQQTTTTPEIIGEGTGGFTDPFMNRVVLPLTGDYAENDHVLGHEMVHVFQFDIASSLANNRRRFNLEMMPRLESFAAHQLYALAAKHETGTWHALRLGFFPDEQSAEGPCEHLRTYFSAATVVRVSVAEQTRFVPRTAAAAPVQKPAATSVTTPAASPAVPRSQVADATVETPAPHLQTRRNKTLAQELLEEAREVQLARSGRKQAPEQSSSWITRLFGRPSERPRAASRR